ncbi:hypothetical protein AAG906_028101 [Vitis piasezkii]
MEYNWNANIKIFGRRGPAPGVRLGGVLGDSLTRVAGMQADALLFAEARKQEEKGSDATGDHDRIVVNDGSILQWAHVLEPIRSYLRMGKSKLESVFMRLWRRIHQNGQRKYWHIQSCMGPPSDDSEDGDHNPNDFTSTLDRRNFSDNEDGLDGQRRFVKIVGEEKFLVSDSFLGNERSNFTGGDAGIAISKNSGIIMLAGEDSDPCQKSHDHVCHSGPPNSDKQTMQTSKIKAEFFHIQIYLHFINSTMTCSNDEMATEDMKVAGVKSKELSIRYFVLCSKAGIHAPSLKVPDNFHSVKDIAGENLDGSIQVFKALFAACDRLLEELQKLNKAINQTIDLTDFISKLNDTKLIHTALQADVVTTDAQASGQVSGEPQNGLEKCYY